MRRVPEATFYTVSNEFYFVGTVALVNSLRLTGHRQEVVVLDRGLAPRQRRRLAAAATVVDLPLGAARDDAAQTLLKAFPGLLGHEGVYVAIDGDMIVTASLEPIIELARDGAVCGYPDRRRDRWFAEWETGYRLASPPRRQAYLNAGLVAFSPAHHPRLLGRWWEVCQAVAAGEPSTGDPAFRWYDQDALNALLSSEVPEEALHVLPAAEGPAFDLLDRTEVVDARTLASSCGGTPTALLHHAGGPSKPWSHDGGLRIRRNAYVQLLTRVLFGPDVVVRLEPDDVPAWLHPGRAGGLRLRLLSARNAFLQSGWDALPRPLRHGLARLKGATATGGSH